MRLRPVVPGGRRLPEVVGSAVRRHWAPRCADGKSERSQKHEIRNDSVASASFRISCFGVLSSFQSVERGSDFRLIIPRSATRAIKVPQNQAQPGPLIGLPLRVLHSGADREVTPAAADSAGRSLGGGPVRSVRPSPAPDGGCLTRPDTRLRSLAYSSSVISPRSYIPRIVGQFLGGLPDPRPPFPPPIHQPDHDRTDRGAPPPGRPCPR